MEASLAQFQRWMAKLCPSPLDYPPPHYINGKPADDEELHFLGTTMRAGIKPLAIVAYKGGTNFITQ